MTLRRRVGIAVVLAIPTLFAYAAVRYYSTELIGLVVERTLAEKTPPGTDQVTVAARMHAMIAAAPNRQAKLEKLLELSQYLEKRQALTRPELEMLLGNPEVRNRD
jgi:hypothetical protein